MTENKTEFELIADFWNLYQAYKTSISGKKLNKEKIKFQSMALDGIYQICRLLETKKYKVSPYKKFKYFSQKSN